MSIYVLVQEGPHQILGIFDTLEDARVYQAACFYKKRRMHEIAEIYRGFSEPQPSNYLIQKMPWNRWILDDEIETITQPVLSEEQAFYDPEFLNLKEEIDLSLETLLAEALMHSYKRSTE